MFFFLMHSHVLILFLMSQETKIGGLVFLLLAFFLMDALSLTTQKLG